MSKVSRLEVIETGARRRWSLEEKLRIVAESDRGRRQVSATARRHGLSASQLFTWRRLARAGRLCADEAMTFAPVVVSSDGPANAAPALPAVASGRIEIVLVGGVRVIVAHDVDAAALARVISVLDRR